MYIFVIISLYLFIYLLTLYNNIIPRVGTFYDASDRVLFPVLTKRHKWQDSNKEYFDFESRVLRSAFSFYSKSQKYSDKSARGAKFKTGAMFSKFKSW